jgi:hypothetical protein
MYDWEINGFPPNMAQMGAVYVAWHKARQICHLEPVPSASDFVPNVASSSTTDQQPLRQTTASGAIVNLRTLKVSAHLDQRSSSEITFLPTADIQKMYHRYVQAWHEMPSADVKPTDEQLAALQHTKEAGMVPYADLSIVGPHGVRFHKKQMMSGLMLNRDGQFLSAEFYGPPSIELWTASYDVLAAALIMIGAVSRPVLSAYRKKMKMLNQMYGPSVWHLLYQTDVRCRQELMAAIFHELLADHNTALETGTPSRFDPAEPWDQVWSTATKRVEFWTDQFERPAGLIASHVRQLSSVIDGDVQITRGKGSPQQQQPPSGGPRVQQPKKKANKKKPFGKNGRDSPPCVICKSEDHAMTACHLYDPNHGKGKGGRKGKKGKGKDA